MSTMLKVGGAIVALVVVVALVVTLTSNEETTVASPQDVAEDAATWLGGQLENDADGDYFEVGFPPNPTDPDPGLTSDGLIAFVAADEEAGGSYSTEIAGTLDWITTPVNLSGYVGNGGGSNDLKAGALAKVIVALLTAGEDPTDVGGRNLVTQLEGLEQGSGGSDPGRFSSQGTDNSNTTGQALAIIGLNEADPSYTNGNGATLPDAVDYLVSQQCPGGAVEGAFSYALDDVTNCAANADIDSTAVAAQALLTSSDPDAQDAGDLAVDWLVSQQSGSGYWQSNACDYPNLDPSVNSTSLAVPALEFQGSYPTEADDGVSWLESTANTGPDYGLPACGASGQGDVRATVQGVPGLLELPYPELVAP